MLIRYPGSKAKLADAIVGMFPDEFRYHLWAGSSKYVEPFFGAGAIGFRVISLLPSKASVLINDADYGIACLWQAVLSEPKKLQQRIAAFRPTAEAFYEFKSSDGQKFGSVVSVGFRKLAVHQMSVSGFGVMSGGPLGGKDQRNAAYPVDCRWNPERLQKHVAVCHAKLRRFKDLEIRNDDFQSCLSGLSESDFVYADPPYVEKGPQLYKHSMNDKDHQRLAQCLKSLPCRWALSYDDHELVRSLYADCHITPLEVRYSNAISRDCQRPKNREVLITGTAP